MQHVGLVFVRVLVPVVRSDVGLPSPGWPQPLTLTIASMDFKVTGTAQAGRSSAN
jgi:hypothetical protein